MTTIEKIVSLMEKKQISARQLEIAASLSNASVQAWKSGKAKPSAEALTKIADYFNISVDYLLGRTDAPQTNKLQEVPIDTILPGAVPATEYQLYRAPIIGSVRAGFGSVASEDILGYDYLTSHDLVGHDLDEFFFLRVKGDSMEPELHENDRLLVHRQSSVDNDSLAVVIVDNEEGTVKNIKYGKSWIQLSSINPDYPPRVFEGQDVTRVSVIGLVKKIVRLC